MNRYLPVALAGIIAFSLIVSVIVWAFIAIGWFILLLAGLLGAWFGVADKKKKEKSEVDGWLDEIGMHRH